MSDTAHISELLRGFTDARGVSGSETQVAELFSTALTPLVDTVRIDTMGNVIGSKAGQGPSVMLAAHMDEIGMMVNHIDEHGFLRFVSIGGWVGHALAGQRVTVEGSKGPLIGVVGVMPHHLLDEEALGKAVKLSDLFVDVGAADAGEASELGVEIGDVIVVDRVLREMGNGLVTGRALDNRAGMVVLLAAMERLQGETVGATVHVVGTVQEEVGLKGAWTSAYHLDPDVALVADVTIPGDHPGVTRQQRDIAVGSGPALTVAEASGRGVIASPRVLAWLRAAAEGAEIPIQLDVAARGATDATIIQLTRGGIPTGVVNIPTRYMHSPVEVLSLADLDHGADLVAKAVLTMGEHF